MRQNRPEIGTKMYSVHEHLYRLPGRTGLFLEYCVCEAEVVSFFTLRYTEVKVVGPSPEGYPTPYMYKLSEIGKKIFYTPREAALLAKEETEKREHTWGWLGPSDIPMRRPWEKYLTGE